MAFMRCLILLAQRSTIGSLAPALVLSALANTGCESKAGEGSETIAHRDLVLEALTSPPSSHSVRDSAWGRMIALGNEVVPALELMLEADSPRGLKALIALSHIGTPRAFNAGISAARDDSADDSAGLRRLLPKLIQNTERWDRSVLDPPNAKWLDCLIEKSDEETAARLIHSLGAAHYRTRLLELSQSDNPTVQLMARVLLTEFEGFSSPAVANPMLSLQLQPDAKARLVRRANGTLAITVSVPMGSTSMITLRRLDDGITLEEWPVDGRVHEVTILDEQWVLATATLEAPTRSRLEVRRPGGALHWSSHEVKGRARDVAIRMGDDQVRGGVLSVSADSGAASAPQLHVIGADGSVSETIDRPLLLGVHVDRTTERYLFHTHTTLQWWTPSNGNGIRLDRAKLPLSMLKIVILGTASPACVVVGGETEEGAGGLRGFSAQFRALWSNDLPVPVEALAVAACERMDESLIAALTIDGAVGLFDPRGAAVMRLRTGWAQPFSPSRSLSIALERDMLVVMIHDTASGDTRVYQAPLLDGRLEADRG